jgi:hypothetical protein
MQEGVLRGAFFVGAEGVALPLRASVVRWITWLCHCGLEYVGFSGEMGFLCEVGVDI